MTTLLVSNANAEDAPVIWKITSSLTTEDISNFTSGQNTTIENPVSYANLYISNNNATENPHLGTISSPITNKPGMYYFGATTTGTTSGPVYVDTYTNEAEKVSIFLNNKSHIKNVTQKGNYNNTTLNGESSIDTYTLEGAGNLNLNNSSIQTATVGQNGNANVYVQSNGADATRASTINLLINHGQIAQLVVSGRDNETVQDFKNDGTVHFLTGDVKKITSTGGFLGDFQPGRTDTITLTDTTVGNTGFSEDRDSLGFTINASSIIGTNTSLDAITINGTSQVNGFSNLGTINGNIKIEHDATIADDPAWSFPKSGLYGGINNGGTINGAIIYQNPDKELTIVNHGVISKNNGSDANLDLTTEGVKVRVKEWYVHVDGENVTKDTAMVVAGGTGKLKVDKVVITDIKGTQRREDGNPWININTAVLDKKDNSSNPLDDTKDETKETARPREVAFSQELQDYGLGASYYHLDNGWIQTDLVVEKTANSVLTQTLVNQISRREVFVEAALADVSESNLYHLMQYQQGKMWFVKPYYSVDKSELAGGTTVKGHTTGFLAGGTAMPNNENIISFYLGYENHDGTATNLDLNMDTLYGGAKYVRLFGRADNHDYFAKADVMGGYTSSDVQRTREDAKADGTAHTLNYNAALHVGMNYYMPFMSALTPEVGVGVTGGSTRAFDITGTSEKAKTERYDSTNMNVAYGDVSLKWFQNWHPTLGTPLIKTLVAGGIRYNFNHSVEVGADVEGVRGKGSVDLPSTYQYLNTSLILDFSKNVSFTLGYVGVYDSTGHSHNATAKFEYSF